MDGQGKSHQARECVGSPSNHDSVLFSTYDVRPSPGANIDNSCRWRNNTVEDPVTISLCWTSCDRDTVLYSFRQNHINSFVSIEARGNERGRVCQNANI